MKKADEAAKLIRKARAELGLDREAQQDLIRRARATMGVTNGELAAALEVSEPTLIAWLAPDSAPKLRTKHRTMPADYKLPLQRVLDGYRVRARKSKA